jgi:hypothetical protein
MFWRKNHVRQWIVLSLDPIELGDDPRTRPIAVRGDDRPEAAERVVTLGAAPLRKVGILVEHIGRGHVVDAGVAENVAAGVAHRDIMAAQANDDTQFALEHDLALISRRPPYRLLRTDDAGARLDEIQRMRGSLLPELGGQSMKVVPKGNDLGGYTRTSKRKISGSERYAGRPRRPEDITLILRDLRAVESAETFLAVMQSITRPTGHGQTVPRLC